MPTDRELGFWDLRDDFPEVVLSDAEEDTVGIPCVKAEVFDGTVQVHVYACGHDAPVASVYYTANGTVARVLVHDEVKNLTHGTE